MSYWSDPEDVVNGAVKWERSKQQKSLLTDVKSGSGNFMF